MPMLSDKALEEVLKRLQSRLDEVNTFYIQKVVEQIKKIGELGQANINRLAIMAEMTSDVQEITERLMEATSLNKKDIQEIFNQAALETYTDQRFTKAFVQGNKPTAAARQRFAQYAENVSRQTTQNIENLSNTTAIRSAYRDAVDKGILAVSTGLGSYNAATRQIIREIGYNGMQVQYASGYHRRLDTAIRQNVIDGTKQIAQHGANIIGEALGYQEVEISAHMHSAPDHEPVQGRVFLKTEFDKMQAGLSFVDINGRPYAGFKRPIAEWNCGHFALPFDSRYSKPRYTEQQLQDWAAKNNAGCDMDGKHYTTYQAQQLMRKIETRVRRYKDTANAARLANDDTLRRECQMHINGLAAKYEQLATLSGLPMRKERMSVEGFRMVKVNKE